MMRYDLALSLNTVQSFVEWEAAQPRVAPKGYEIDHWASIVACKERHQNSFHFSIETLWKDDTCMTYYFRQ